MLRFLLVPLAVIQLFMMFGWPADGANASDVGVGRGSNGAIAEATSAGNHASPGWDPNGTDAGPGWDPDG